MEKVRYMQNKNLEEEQINHMQDMTTTLNQEMQEYDYYKKKKICQKGYIQQMKMEIYFQQKK